MGIQVGHRGGFRILDGDFDGALGGIEELGGASLGLSRRQRRLLDGLLGGGRDVRNRQRDKVGFRNGRVHAGAGVQIHERAYGRQAKIRQQDVGANRARLQDDEAGRAHIAILVGLNDRRQATDRAHCRGDDIPNANVLRCPARGFAMWQTLRLRGAIATDTADFDVMKIPARRWRETLLADRCDILNCQPVAAKARKHVTYARREKLRIQPARRECFAAVAEVAERFRDVPTAQAKRMQEREFGVCDLPSRIFTQPVRALYRRSDAVLEWLGELRNQKLADLRDKQVGLHVARGFADRLGLAIPAEQEGR